MKKAAVKLIVVVAMAAAMLLNTIIPVAAVEYTQTVLESYFSYFPSASGWYDVQTILYDTMPTTGMYQMADGAGFGPCFLVDEWAKDAVYIITADITYTFSNTAGANSTLSSENLTGRNLALFNTSRPVSTTQSDLVGSNSQGIDYSSLVNFSFSPLSSTTTSGTYTCTQVISFSTESGQVDNIDNKLWATFWTCFDQEGKFSYNNMTLSVIYNAEPSVYDLILEKLDDILSKLDTNQSTTNNYYQTIEQAVTEIINNQTTQINNESTIINQQQQTNTKLDTVNNNLQTIYNVGDGNNIPNNGSALGNAQQQLHNSEEALTNKSESIASRAADGINTAKTSSTQFISTITPAVSTVTGTVTQAIESLPQEIQPMVYSMPLLSFAVWLIGLKR